jgi:alkylation response protein AidB-like acyl-CoA dehydrogenase
MFATTDEQQLFARIVCRLLETECPPAQLRSLATNDRGYDPEYWRRGADLGWTALAVAEESATGDLKCAGVLDLLVLAFEFGHHAAPGPLGPVSVVASALARWGSAGVHQAALEEMTSGTAVAAWAWSEPAPHDAYREIAVEARRDGDALVLSGMKVPVEGAVGADHLVVTVVEAGYPVTMLLSPKLEGVSVLPMSSIDVTRRFGAVRFENARVPVDGVVGADAEGEVVVNWMADMALLVQLGEMVGAMQWAFDSTLGWTRDRYTFGRPIASYQVIKHRLADMKMWLEASYAITEDAAIAMAEDRPERSEMLNAAKSYVGRFGPELMQEAVQLHGGIGVTADHDLHLFLRRMVADASTMGTAREHTVNLGRIVEERS